MKFLIKTQINNIDNFIKSNINNFLFDLKDYSTDNENEITLEQIKDLKEKYKDIKISVTINKHIYNEELNKLENTLNCLNKLIDKVFFYDLSILSLYNKNKYNYDLVWSQTHMVTNYNTCNYFYEKNSKYGLISNEITLDEIKEIKNKTNMNLIITIVSLLPMGHSKRKLITNYYESNNKEISNNQLLINEPVTKEDYLVKENKIGTSFYYSKIYNGTNAFIELKDDNYTFLFNLVNYPIEKQIKIINFYNKDNVSFDESVKLLNTNYEGFLFTKTIYKVKKNVK